MVGTMPRWIHGTNATPQSIQHNPQPPNDKESPSTVSCHECRGCDDTLNYRTWGCVRWGDSTREVGGVVGRGEDAHAGDMAVDEPQLDGELVEHAEGDGVAGGLGPRRAALQEECLGSHGGERLGHRHVGRAATHHGHAQRARRRGGGGAGDGDGDGEWQTVDIVAMVSTCGEWDWLEVLRFGSGGCLEFSFASVGTMRLGPSWCRNLKIRLGPTCQ
jgi:hypothetical protein